jgi:protocatechuate 3,4-dioxygenase beta subunit
VLCDLEERSLEEAAVQLGWPLGTVKSRLNRGRQRLRDRLVRRGVAPAIAGLADTGSPVSVSPALAEATARMMVGTAMGPASVPAAVLALVEGVGRMMLMTRLKLAAVVVVVLGLAAIGIGALASGPPRGAGTEATAQVVTDAPGSQKVAAEAKGEAAPAGRKRRARPDDIWHPETIAVSGRATDPSGRPVAGATVYVIDTNRQSFGDMKPMLATATTGPDGRFVVRDVERPVWKPQPAPELAAGQAPVQADAVEEGRFQVAATAPGFGFTWHAIASYQPADRPRAPAPKAGPDADGPEAYYRGEPIDVDLSFGPPASLRGKVIDDLGRPLAGVKVQVGACDGGPSGHLKMSSCSRVQPLKDIPYERRAFSGIRELPEAVRSARTGPDGFYRFDGLPREAEFLVRIDPGAAFEPYEATIATTAVPVVRAVTGRTISSARYLGHDAVLDRTFVAPREVRFTVRSAATGRPVRGATVRATTDPTRSRAGGGAVEFLRLAADLLGIGVTGDLESAPWSFEMPGLLREGGVGVTDPEGRATLHLRPGEYGYRIEPALADFHLPSKGSFQVGQEAAVEISEIQLEAGAIVTIEALDARTRAGVEGVSFLYETGEGRRRRELRSRPGIVDHPETDARGRLRAIVEPGRKRFSVAKVPAGWKLDEKPTGTVELDGGREATIQWALGQVDGGPAAAGSGPALFPDDLVETWRRQERRALPGKFRVRHYSVNAGRVPTPANELESFLDANDLAAVPDPAAALNARFPTLPEGSWQSYEIIDDGRRRRNTHRFPSLQGAADVTLFNGLEVVNDYASNGQVDIVRSGESWFVVLGLRDVCAWPAMSGSERPAVGKIRRDESGGRLTVEQAADDFSERWVVDRKTGFVHADTRRSTRNGPDGHIVRQYGPKTHRDGVVLPTVHVRVGTNDANISSLDIDIIEEVQLDYRPSPVDFTLAAPAGTNVFDHRADRSNPAGGTILYPVADVIAYADGSVAIDPVLKVGDAAPPIRPARWLDRGGPPDLTGKVVLVVFWGLDGGPYLLAEPPELQAATAQMGDRGKDLVVIGLQGSEVAADEALDDQVAAFARERGMTYRRAIDRPAGEKGWHGATFEDYGVRAVSAAAVIDRRGNVAYVGQSFPRALEEAAKRLGP